MVKGFKLNLWSSWLGDCPVVTKYLNSKPPSIKWDFLRAGDTFLRAVGQPAFVNNPILGLLIWIAMFYFDLEVGLGCLLGGGLATLTEIFLGLHPEFLVTNGVAAFNGVLVGTVTSILFPLVYETERSFLMWTTITLGSMTSVALAGAFNNAFGALKLPYMALPFNIIAVITFLTIQPPEIDTSDLNFKSVDNSSLANIAVNLTTNDEILSISWIGVGRGIAVSMGQVYAVDDVVASSLMNLAVFLSSPLLFLMSTLGAVVGSFLGLMILPYSDLTQVYSGLWGYNSLLSMAATSCVFFPLSPSSFLVGLLNIFITVGAQQALRINLDKNILPVFTLPMTLCTLVILLVAQTKSRRRYSCGPPLQRCEEMSYAEKQAYQAWKAHMADIEVATEEEKEPALEKQ